jgi:hypothetical protein
MSSQNGGFAQEHCWTNFGFGFALIFAAVRTSDLIFRGMTARQSVATVGSEL